LQDDKKNKKKEKEEKKASKASIKYLNKRFSKERSVLKELRATTERITIMPKNYTKIKCPRLGTNASARKIQFQPQQGQTIKTM
jgi:hypothetical protein